MKTFRGLKFLFCLAFAFIFMFGNSFFVQASTIESDEVQQLRVKFKLNDETLEFNGFIAYKCTDPYRDKRITSVGGISLWVGRFWNEVFDFKQQFVDSISISEDGKTVHALVYGKLTEHNENVDYVYHIKVPVVYSINR